MVVRTPLEAQNFADLKDILDRPQSNQGLGFNALLFIELFVALWFVTWVAELVLSRKWKVFRHSNVQSRHAAQFFLSPSEKNISRNCDDLPRTLGPERPFRRGAAHESSFARLGARLANSAAVQSCAGAVFFILPSFHFPLFMGVERNLARVPKPTLPQKPHRFPSLHVPDTNTQHH